VAHRGKGLTPCEHVHPGADECTNTNITEHSDVFVDLAEKRRPRTRKIGGTSAVVLNRTVVGKGGREVTEEDGHAAELGRGAQREEDEEEGRKREESKCAVSGLLVEG
jgi:hypothetical protein